LNARGYFDNRSIAKNPQSSDQFGVQFDGPVTLPGYDGRNRTFFMAAFEGIRQEAQSSPIISVPTDRMRRGDFSEIATAIRNPFTGERFPGNVIPASLLSPIALRVVEYYPRANLP